MAKIIVIGSFAESLINFRGPLLREMVSRGHEVFACAPDASLDIQEKLKAFGVAYRNIPIDRTGLDFVRDIYTIFRLVSLFREVKPDKVLAYTIKPVLYSSLAARVIGLRGMYSMITGLGYAFSDSDSFKHKTVSIIVNSLYKQALKSNMGMFFQNPDDLEEFKARGLIPERTKVVIINGSGVNLSYFGPIPLPKKPSFLLIARLIKSKGIREYVEAARIVKNEYPEIEFKLVGWLETGPDAVSDKELRKWQNGNVIDYLGEMEDVRPAIADSMIYALPSYREGTPRTVLEAMAMGRPIITTDTPGCRETVTNGINGFLVPPRDSRKLAEVMMRFIKQPYLVEKMGRESRRIAEEKFDVHKVNEVILKGMGL